MINYVEFGKALYLLSKEDNVSDTVAEQLKAICDLLKEDETLIDLLDTPAIASGEKPKIIDKIFVGTHEYIINFIKIITSKGAFYQFEKCVDSFFVCYDKDRNILRAEAITAYPMSQEQITLLQTKLSIITGKDVIVTNTVDKTLIGGVKLRYDGNQLDGSIKSHVEELRKKLSETIV